MRPRPTNVVSSGLGVRRGGLRCGFATLALLCVADGAFAQLVPGTAQPGREREQLIDRRVAPSVQPGGPAISLPSTEAPAGAAQTMLVIRRIQVVGATVYNDEQLAPLYRDLLNRKVTLEAVYDIAKRITAKYGADGYVLSRAIVPPQELSPGGVSRDRLLGVAPGARILAVRAFSETQTTAESTTFTILKSIEWAVSQGARVINMSFAGPYDPSLERALKDAAAKGVILIGASGNAGPKSPPLWPDADPHVIAVTATDSGDKLFRQANRGPYVSVASPGVEILAPAPQAGYQMSTGTSIATAHVSGVVALMLERDPTLTPLDVRLILESTASDLGPKGRDTQFGWGLVSPARALAMVDERKRQRGTASTPARR